MHYGWARGSVRKDYETVIEECAYETIPNKPIPLAGKNVQRYDAI
jgi:hypothetical protein